MKKIEKIAQGNNFAAVNAGSWDEIQNYELPMGPNVLKGKVFVGTEIGLTGSELSFQTLVPGQDSGFLHTHKTHEEVYIILRGKGEYQVDGQVFPVCEGSVIRVSPKGKRALKNSSTENLTMLCIQYKANSFTDADNPMADGNILQELLRW
ncbi:MAG: cupin domain-containing protein [Bacteroidales bacterium]|nr:cupin domain-containing protein [Bacteroidales bacterium]